MAERIQQDVTGEFQSPGGFVFGIQGWNWGEQRPSAITFFLNGTAKVSDQHGRPIRGVVKEGKPLYFDKCSHAQVVELLVEERVDWQTLTYAGWPQLPYDALKALKSLPPWPFDNVHQSSSPVSAPCSCVVCSIRDPKLRQDSIRIYKEQAKVMEEAMKAVEVQAAGTVS